VIEAVVCAVIFSSADVCEVTAVVLDTLVILVLVNIGATVSNIVAVVTAVELYVLDTKLP